MLAEFFEGIDAFAMGALEVVGGGLGLLEAGGHMGFHVGDAVGIDAPGEIIEFFRDLHHDLFHHIEVVDSFDGHAGADQREHLQQAGGEGAGLELDHILAAHAGAFIIQAERDGGIPEFRPVADECHHVNTEPGGNVVHHDAAFNFRDEEMLVVCCHTKTPVSFRQCTGIRRRFKGACAGRLVHLVSGRGCAIVGRVEKSGPAFSWRRILHWIWRRVESVLFFAAWAGFLAPLLFVRARRCRADEEEILRIRQRWRTYRQTGLLAVRRAFWPGLQFENQRDVWFYVLLIEYFAVLRATTVRQTSGEEKILVVKLAHFGDALHTFPMMRALRAQRPAARIDLLVGPWCRGLAKTYAAYYDRLRVQHPRLSQFERGSKSTRHPLWKEIAFLRALGAEGYTHGLATGGSSLADVLLMYATPGCRWSGVAMPALYALGAPHTFTRYDSRQYEAERIMQLLRPLGLTPGDSHLFYPSSAEDTARAAELRAAAGIAPHEQYAIVCPCAGWAGKQWPPERFAAVVGELYRRRGCKTILAGARTEMVYCAKVEEAAGVPVLNLAGKTSIGELAALMAEAALFVGNDSGPMHLAACFETPFVVFFGPTIAGKWAPRHSPGVCLQHEECEGCIPWHYQAVCVHQNRCMENISLEEALDAVAGVMRDATLPEES